MNMARFIEFFALSAVRLVLGCACLLACMFASTVASALKPAHEGREQPPPTESCTEMMFSPTSPQNNGTGNFHLQPCEQQQTGQFAGAKGLGRTQRNTRLSGSSRFVHVGLGFRRSIVLTPPRLLSATQYVKAV